MRVLASNPEQSDDSQRLSFEPALDWRLVRYRMAKPDGSWLNINQLESAEDLTGFVPRMQVELSYPELAIEGPAEIVSIQACPAIESGAGEVVTATFHHTAANVLNLHIAVEPEPIGTTSNHPFWSEDRFDWVQAGDLQPGEHLRLIDGTLTTVDVISRNPETQPVYNLTVNALHTYHVGASGVLVHNSQNYNTAMGKALNWLSARGFNSSSAKPFSSRSSTAHMGGRINGLRDAGTGYRIEYDVRSGAHINVFSGKEKGPHFSFLGNEADVMAILRQLFGG